MDADKEQLRKLILDAERLMATARAEAKDLVSSAELQAKELVDAARQLYAAAEAEAQTIQHETATVRATAERQARALLDDAQQKHAAALEQARSIAVAEPDAEPSGVESDVRDSGDEALLDASRRVDQMLRVARSEAKANADELLEQARRRAAQIDEDARRREDVAAKQHRALLQSMRDEQLAIRTRIAEMRSELRAAEAAAHPDHVDAIGPRDMAVRAEVSESVPDDHEKPERPQVRKETTPIRPVVSAPRATQHQRPSQPQTAGEVDDDYAKAVKRFRRRA